MSQSQEKNKALVLEAFDTLFNRRIRAAERSGRRRTSSTAHIAPGREGYSNSSSLPPTLKYEPGLSWRMATTSSSTAVSGFGSPRTGSPRTSCIEDGILVEHWDVIQDEATEEQSKSKAPMFGSSFPVYATSEKSIG